MSRATLFNLPANTLTPGPKLVIGEQPDGKLTGSMDFYCRKGDLGKSTIQGKLAKPKTIAALYPEIGSGFPYLYLADYTGRDEPGGYTVVSCNFEGLSAAEGDSTFESASVVYTRNNSLRDTPIFSHPKYISELPAQTQESIRLGAIGAARMMLDAGTLPSYIVISIVGDEEIETITDEVHKWWWDYVVTQGNHTYVTPGSEWTKSATGKAKLRPADLVKQGKIDTPPGEPSAPTGHKWMMTGATEEIKISGDGVNSYSITWTSGVYETKIYGP